MEMLISESRENVPMTQLQQFLTLSILVQSELELLVCVCVYVRTRVHLCPHARAPVPAHACLMNLL